ncbi:hypothetical protein pqer_cds_928 [Pandoravirus quercus]|uniref:Uncharacterized protein n=2 Tax=Pandoravirus TaxID=2060084 RepID=A0A2U7UAE3_9VIRU|nr:hypothetical protein pqer_cds_928 [Pandoravirus quercus]AVK75350.1 hypothetical protein pqer_cds_928 [Pandoravirus quercus]QBZ81528.1 hypothetical protein pclt_cds_942 [Pandoravirus celtis]
MDHEIDSFDVWMRAMLARHRGTLETTGVAPPPNNNAPRPYGAMDALASHVASTGRAALSATDTSSSVDSTQSAVMRAGLDALDALYADPTTTSIDARPLLSSARITPDGPF